MVFKEKKSKIPFMDENFVNLVSNRYIELFEKVSAIPFKKAYLENTLKRIEENVLKFLKN